jgi:anti-sigma regulatory factor (Ser/Thr protein kinase)
VNPDEAIDGYTGPSSARGGPTRLPSASEDAASEGRFVRLSPGPFSPQQARASLRWLGAHLDLHGLAAALLVTSELVTNAVVHSTLEPEYDWIRVEAGLLPGCVRIEVRDSGPGYELGYSRLPPQEALNGRGLWLMARLADRWGHDLPGASRIWFELDRAENGDQA